MKAIIRKEFVTEKNSPVVAFYPYFDTARQGLIGNISIEKVKKMSKNI